MVYLFKKLKLATQANVRYSPIIKCLRELLYKYSQFSITNTLLSNLSNTEYSALAECRW